MNTKLLTDWAEALEALNQINWREAGFNMQDWVRNSLPIRPLLGCGTVCCAYGVGTTLPSWKEAGLGFIPNPFASVLVGLPYIPTKKAEDILGISTEEFFDIISTSSYPYTSIPQIAPGLVAERIRKLIAAK